MTNILGKTAWWLLVGVLCVALCVALVARAAAMNWPERVMERELNAADMSVAAVMDDLLKRHRDHRGPPTEGTLRTLCPSHPSYYRVWVADHEDNPVLRCPSIHPRSDRDAAQRPPGGPKQASWLKQVRVEGLARWQVEEKQRNPALTGGCYLVVARAFDPWKWVVAASVEEELVQIVEVVDQQESAWQVAWGATGAAGLALLGLFGLTLAARIRKKSTNTNS